MLIAAPRDSHYMRARCRSNCPPRYPIPGRSLSSPTAPSYQTTLLGKRCPVAPRPSPHASPCQPDSSMLSSHPDFSRPTHASDAPHATLAGRSAHSRIGYLVHGPVPH